MSLGYEEIKNTLMEDMEKGSFFHAYIFEGDPTSKKKELAEELAKKLLDTEHLENCSDYFLLEKSAMKIESIRKITADSFIEPFKEKKVYVVEEAMDMTVPMQNAFLKTLEEPPSYAIFFLLCENKAPLLETIRSRCIHYYLPPAGEEATLGEDSVKRTMEFFEALASKDEMKLMSLVDGLKGSKDSVSDILNLMLTETGNLLLDMEISSRDEEGKTYGSPSILSSSLKENCKRNLRVFEVLKFIDIIEDTRRKIGSRCALNLSLEVMLFDILEVIG